MKAINRRKFLTVSGFTAAAVAVPIKSQSAAASPPQSMNLNDDDPSVTFTVPTSMKNMFFRAGAKEIA